MNSAGETEPSSGCFIRIKASKPVNSPGSVLKKGWKFIEKGSLNIVFDHFMFDYQDFRDLRNVAATPGSEPLYNFDADVFEFFASFWF